MSEATEIKQALAQRGDRAEAPHIYDALELHRAQLAKKLPPGVLTYEQAEAAFRTELSMNKALRECDPRSQLGAFAHSLQLGLLLGPLDLVHLIPFGGKVTFIIGYRGYIELAYRTGLVKDVSAHLVYAGDMFKVYGGTSPKIVHEIEPRNKREIAAAYAVAHLKTGGTVSNPIFQEDWETARGKSELGRKGKGPWATDFPAMVRKTAYRRLEPMLPKSPGMALAEAWDDQPAEPVADVLEGE